MLPAIANHADAADMCTSITKDVTQMDDGSDFLLYADCVETDKVTREVYGQFLTKNCDDVDLALYDVFDQLFRQIRPMSRPVDGFGLD